MEKSRINRETAQPPNPIHYELISKLEFALETEKCYLDCNLTLTRLAQKLQTNREYLSSTINHYYHKTYTDLINEYRVKEATLILGNISNGTQAKHNMPEVAHASGFKSISTFNPAFKRVVGKTPTGWRKEVIEGNSKMES
jgi:AraC-like DNA-binding protein